MAFTLGPRITLVPPGVAFPFLVLIANVIGLKRNDPVASLLAQRWSQVMAVLFAVGAVSGTVLSSEMGLLWPGLTGIYGHVFGLPISMGGNFLLPGSHLYHYLHPWMEAPLGVGALRVRRCVAGMLLSTICGVGALLLVRRNARLAGRSGRGGGTAGGPLAHLRLPPRPTESTRSQSTGGSNMSQNGSRASAGGPPHVVVVGGGFGGVAAAQALKNAPVRVTLVDRTNYHLFQPLLYQVATGVLEPGTITTPIRSLFRGQKEVDVLMAEVTGVDKERRLVELTGGRSIPYDYLVLATGVQGSYFGHDEWAPLAPSMKTLADAEFLRRRIIGALEQADQETDPELREQLMTFVLVGAGPTGCELAGELAQHFHRVPAEYRHIDPRQARIILVEAGPRALATFSEQLAQGAVNKLRNLGVDVRLGKAVELVDDEGVVIAGERVKTRTVLWTAGVAASPAGRWLGAETDRAGRVVVGPDLSIADHPEIFVVGDTAHIENDSKLLPGVAQVALQSGKHAAHTIRARVLHQPAPGAFSYFDKGNMATISQGYAIMEKDKLKLDGPLGKTGWAFIHVLYLGRAEGQLMLCMQWIFGVLFGRLGSRYIDTPSFETTARPAAPVAAMGPSADRPAS
jgi:NADH dehydrogenase FAD-containing subunit